MKNLCEKAEAHTKTDKTGQKFKIRKEIRHGGPAIDKLYQLCIGRNLSEIRLGEKGSTYDWRTTKQLEIGGRYRLDFR